MLETLAQTDLQKPALPAISAHRSPKINGKHMPGIFGAMESETNSTKYFQL